MLNINIYNDTKIQGALNVVENINSFNTIIHQSLSKNNINIQYKKSVYNNDIKIFSNLDKIKNIPFKVENNESYLEDIQKRYFVFNTDIIDYNLIGYFKSYGEILDYIQLNYSNLTLKSLGFYKNSNGFYKAILFEYNTDGRLIPFETKNISLMATQNQDGSPNYDIIKNSFLKGDIIELVYTGEYIKIITKPLVVKNIIAGYNIIVEEVDGNFIITNGGVDVPNLIKKESQDVVTQLGDFYFDMDMGFNKYEVKGIQIKTEPIGNIIFEIYEDSTYSDAIYTSLENDTIYDLLSLPMEDKLKNNKLYYKIINNSGVNLSVKTTIRATELR